METYKILIKKCIDPRRAAMISEEIAKLSGSPTQSILAALQKKDVCIWKEVDGIDAISIKSIFESIGASIELVKLKNLGTSPITSETSRNNDDYDEEKGRVLSNKEYSDQLKNRPDIFTVEKESMLRNLEVICVILAFIVGLYLSTREIIEVATDFIDNLPDQIVVKIVEDIPVSLKEDQDEKKEDIKTEKIRSKPKREKGAGGQIRGGGDPIARVTKKGVLGIISGQITGKTIASADIFGKGGFASGIDAVLSGVEGLKGGGSGGVGRKSATGIGYGAGYGSGFGGGSGGIDDLISNLMNSDGGVLNIKKRSTLKIVAPTLTNGRALIGGRSKASIIRVVMQNLTTLRYAYNKRLREKPGLKGRITIKFAIDEFGKVIFCSVENSNMDDPQLEKVVIGKIKCWIFEKIDKPGDVTEVIYPFVFSQ